MKRLLTAGVAGLLVFTAACGDDDDASPAATGAGATTEPAVTTVDAGTDAGETETTEVAGTTEATGTTDATGTTVVGEDAPAEMPERIVSLAPTHTETLFAIGAGEQVVAVDEHSNHPDQAVELQTALSGFDPNVEAITEHDPDLVVLSRDDGIVDQLDTLGIESWVGDSAHDLDETYDQILQLGDVTGHEAEAQALVAEMQAEVGELTGDLPDGVDGMTFYHEVSDDYYSAGTSSFVGQIYELFGLENIAGDEPFPQLNAEVIVSADPELIFVTFTDAGDVAGRDGWQDIAAVQNGMIFEMDDDLAARWGPRVVEYVRDVRDALDTIAGSES